jgi:hypothetical protein
MYYEGSITVFENIARLELFKAVQEQNQETCEQLLERLSRINDLPPDSEHTVIQWAKRLIIAGRKSLMAQGKTLDEWTSFMWSIQHAIEHEDLDLLADELKIAQSATPPHYPVSYPQVWAA